jgi:hypothetical protein
MGGSTMPVPADIAERMAAYLAALEGLAFHAAAVRDTWRPLAERYTAWCDAEDDRSESWWPEAESATGMDRAAELAGVVTHLADCDLVPGGAHQMACDEAEMVLGEMTAETPSGPVLVDVRRVRIDVVGGRLLVTAGVNGTPVPLPPTRPTPPPPPPPPER